MKVERIYHPVHLWEEMQYNMWGTVEDKTVALQEAIEFTGQHELYGSFMRRVIVEWPYSCENALTDRSINRKAWLGHAASALALQIPENIIRQAWGHLTDDQRYRANNEARAAIIDWEGSRAGSEIYPYMGGTLL